MITDAAFSRAMDLVSFMAALRLSQFVSSLTYQVGYFLDLIFGLGINVELVATEE